MLGLRDYLTIFRRRKWWVLGSLMVVISASLLWTGTITPRFRSEAHVVVRDPASFSEESSAVTINLATEAEWAASAPVADLVREQLGLGDAVSTRAVLEPLTVDVAPATVSTTPPEILIISYVHADPAVAQERTQAFADAYLQFRYRQFVDSREASMGVIEEQIQELEEQLGEVERKIADTRDEDRQAVMQAQADSLTSQIGSSRQQLAQLSPAMLGEVGRVLQPAYFPSSSSGGSYVRNGALALFIGLGLGVALAFLREKLDDSLRGRDDLESNARAPVLAVVPRMHSSKWRAEPVLAVLSEPNSAAAEAYRALRISVALEASRHETRTLLGACAGVGEGESTTTANLGVSVVQSGKGVVTVS